MFNLNFAMALSDAFAKPKNGLFSTYTIANFQLQVTLLKNL